MKLRSIKTNIKNNQRGQAKLALNDYLKKLDNQLLKPFLWCASSTVSVAIVLSGSPVFAEEQLPVLPAAKNTTLELNTPLHSDPSSKNPAVANSNTNSNGIVLDKKRHSASTQTLLPASKEPVHAAPTLKQAAPSSIAPSVASDIEPTDKPTNEFTDQSTEPAFPPERMVQADTPTPQDAPTQPSEPSSEPASSDAPEEPLRERWQFSVEPYFFVPLAVQGDVTVAGRSASIGLGLDDVLSLDRAFDAGLRLEAQHDRLGFILDAFYISAAQSGTVGVTLPEGSLQRFGINTAARVDGDVSLSVDEVTVDAAVSYRIVDTVLGNSAASSPPYPRLVVAPILGLRTKFLWQELEVDSVRIGDISLPVDREFSSSRTTVEPLLGTQIGLDLSERWAINFRGDVSGFNINADQDFTWNLLIGTQYNISPNVSLQLAYRFNGFDFENGEGLRRTRLNLYQNGVWLSGVFRF